MENDDIAIERISVEDLRADKAGTLIEPIASIAYRAFREPPWNDDLEKPRLHFGLGVDLMRRNAVALIAYGLAAALFPVLRRAGFTYDIARTSVRAAAIRALFAKLGFEELAVQDAVISDRTYWLLRL